MANVNEGLARLSDGLFVAAIAVYALALIGFTAEYAFGRVGRTPAEKKAPARELVGAAGGPPVDHSVDHSVGATTDSGVRTSIPTGKVPPSGTKRKKANLIGRWAVGLVVLGALVHLSSILVRAISVDAVPWSNMYEFASVSGLVAVLAFLVLTWRMPQLRPLGAFVLLPVIVLMFLAGNVWYGEASKLVPALRSYWLAIHVFLVSIGEGALLTSAVLTALYLVKARTDKQAADGTPPGRLADFAARLPAAATLDKAAYRVVAFAFPLYTIAIICGAIWAEAAWGRYWGWDPKETWAFIVWVIYAGYLHARATAGWKGRSAAWINLLGFTAIVVNFIVVNMVVTGLHSYAGVS